MKLLRVLLAGALWCASVVVPSAVRAQPGDADVKGLPLSWMPPKGVASHYVAVLLTGDGGFADLVTKVAAGLSERGIGVALFNSRAWLSPRKTPDETAAAVARVVRAAMARYHADSIVLVGYSRGADMAPFVANRLPEAQRKVLGGIAMFGLAVSASFEFHWSDLVKDTDRDTDIPIVPELVKLRGVPMACVYGREEKSSGCRDAPAGLMHVDARDGGHHFDGDPKALADAVLRLIQHAPPAAGKP